MTAAEMVVTASIATAGGVYAIDQALPFGLMELRTHWRFVLVGAVIALVLMSGWLFWHRDCQPNTWGCGRFDDSHWSAT